MSVSLLDLTDGQCRRVVAEHPYRFCGEPKAFGSSWCAACATEVFTRDGLERMKERAAKPMARRARFA